MLILEKYGDRRYRHRKLLNIPLNKNLLSQHLVALSRFWLAIYVNRNIYIFSATYLF